MLNRTALSHAAHGRESDAVASVSGGVMPKACFQHDAPGARDLRHVVSETRLRHEGRPKMQAGVMLEACLRHVARSCR